MSTNSMIAPTILNFLISMHLYTGLPEAGLQAANNIFSTIKKWGYKLVDDECLLIYYKVYSID
jgi:hypothetical protein